MGKPPDSPPVEGSRSAPTSPSRSLFTDPIPETKHQHEQTNPSSVPGLDLSSPAFFAGSSRRQSPWRPQSNSQHRFRTTSGASGSPRSPRHPYSPRDILSTTGSSLWSGAGPDSSVGHHSSSPRSIVTIGGYTLLEVIGRGAFSKVLKAVSASDPSQTFAVKRIAREMQKPEHETRIREELAILAKVQHPSVIKVKESMWNSRHLYIVMELISGGTLNDAITRTPSKRLSEQEAMRIFCQVASAVHLLHTKGVYHRDIKPENILMTEDGVPKVSDFGVSYMHRSATDSTDSETVTRSKRVMSDAFVGTPHYLAPEVITAYVSPRGQRTYDVRKVDVWALGCVLFYMVTGQLAFFAPAGATRDEVMARVRRRRITRFPRHVSKPCRKFINLLLTSNPEKRPLVEEVMQHPFFLKYHQEDSPTGEVSSSRPNSHMETPPKKSLLKKLFGRLGSVLGKRRG